MARNPPPIVVAELKYRCPGGDIKRFTIPGPTADEAIRKAARFDPTGPGVPRYIAARCKPVGLELKQRGRGSQTRSLDELGGARRKPKRRRKREYWVVTDERGIVTQGYLRKRPRVRRRKVR